MRAFLARWLYGRTDGMRHRMLSWPIALAIVIALQGVAGVYLLRLSFNNAAEVYYPADAPAVVLRDELRRDFPSDEALTVLFQGDDLYHPDFLLRLHDLTRRLEQHPLVDRVTAITSFERISGTQDGFAVELLVDPTRVERMSADELRRRVLDDRFAPGLLASRDGRYLALAVRPRVLTSSGQRLELKLAVMSAIDETGLRRFYAGDAGPVTMDVAQLQSILRDSVRFIPLTVGIGLALLGWVVGRLRPVVIGAGAMATVVAPTIAMVAASGQPYTMATAILPSLLAAYTVATLLHLYAGVQRARRTASTPALCVDQAIAETRRPSAYNVLTTGAGLLSLVLVPIPPIQVFGVTGALGTAMVLFTVYVLVPPFLRHWDRKPWPRQSSGMGQLGKIARRITMFSMRWPRAILAVLAALVVALLPYARSVQVETDMLAFFAPTHAINVDTHLIESKLVGVTTLEVSLKGSSPDAFQRVETLRQVKRFQRWLDEMPEVDRTFSMVDLVEEMHWAMNGERPAFRDLPGNDRLLRQYLLVYDGMDLYELVNRDFHRGRIILNLNVHGTREVSEAISKIRSRLEAEPLAGLEVDVGGYGRLVTDQIDLLVSGQLNSFAAAFAQIFIIMTVLWRSPGAAALCMIPNLAPLYFIFVLMGATGINLDLATVMIASVVLGITIDDTIHLFHGYRDRVRRGLPPALAIARAYDSAGRAVLATSVVIVTQFGLLTTSDFIPTANFGLMTAVGLLAGLLFEVLLLPALLALSHWRGPRHDVFRRAAKSSGRPPAAVNSRPRSPLPAGTAIAPKRVLVCHGDQCKRSGAARVWRRLRDEQQVARHLAHSNAMQLTKTSCLGPCKFAPVVQVFPEGTYYGLLEGPALERVVEEHLVAGHAVVDLALPIEAAPKART